MKLKRLLYIIVLPILLMLFSSCSNENIEIIQKDIADYYLGIDDDTLFVQYVSMDINIIDKEDKKYLRFEANISKGKLFNGNKFVFRYEKGLEIVKLNGLYTNLDEGCYVYADLELDDKEYYITNVGYYLDEPYWGENVYEHIYVPRRTNLSKFSYFKLLDVEFKSNFRWNVNKILLNGKESYMFYVDIVTDKKFDKKFEFEVATDGIKYLEPYYTNNDKRMYIILEPNIRYHLIKLKYEYVSINLFYDLDLTYDYPYNN